MNKLDEKQVKMSNKSVDWAKLYDIFETEFRDMYQVASRAQNESHFEMIKAKAPGFLRKNLIFCEIGFSAGLTLRYMYPYFNKIFGLDISPKNVDFTRNELLKEGYSGFELLNSDLMDYDERFAHRFDVISFIHGLEHFTSEDDIIVLGNIKRYLKPGGIFTGALPFKQSFNYRICHECGHIFEVDGHVSSHDLESLRKVFTENGFRIIHLDNYNLAYAVKYCSPLKKVYRTLSYYLGNHRPDCQIEYIVTPI